MSNAMKLDPKQAQTAVLDAFAQVERAIETGVPNSSSDGNKLQVVGVAIIVECRDVDNMGNVAHQFLTAGMLDVVRVYGLASAALGGMASKQLNFGELVNPPPPPLDFPGSGTIQPRTPVGASHES